jgi:hypothetical protein
MCGHVTLLLLLCSVLECGQIKIAVAVVIRYCMNNESLSAESFLASRRNLKKTPFRTIMIGMVYSSHGFESSLCLCRSMHCLTISCIEHIFLTSNSIYICKVLTPSSTSPKGRIVAVRRSIFGPCDASAFERARQTLLTS